MLLAGAGKHFCAGADLEHLQALQSASAFIEMVEQRQGLKIACPEEIALRLGYIDAEQLRALAAPLRNSGYGDYLLRLLDVGPQKVAEVIR